MDFGHAGDRAFPLKRKGIDCITIVCHIGLVCEELPFTVLADLLAIVFERLDRKPQIF